jgi:hypothetical protein
MGGPGDHHGYNASKREHVREDSTRNLSESCKYKLTYRLLQIVLHVMILCTDTCLFHRNNEPCELNYVLYMSMYITVRFTLFE